MGVPPPFPTVCALAGVQQIQMLGSFYVPFASLFAVYVAEPFASDIKL